MKKELDKVLSKIDGDKENEEERDSDTDEIDGKLN